MSRRTELLISIFLMGISIACLSTWVCTKSQPSLIWEQPNATSKKQIFAFDGMLAYERINYTPSTDATSDSVAHVQFLDHSDALVFGCDAYAQYIHDVSNVFSTHHRYYVHLAPTGVLFGCSAIALCLHIVLRSRRRSRRGFEVQRGIEAMKP